MSIRILLKNVEEIDKLLELIKSNYANDYRRTWFLDDRTIALFLHERLGVIGQYTFTVMIIVDFSPEEDQCEVSVRYVGGSLSFLGTGKSEDFIKQLKKKIESLAEVMMWKCEVTPIKIRAAGTVCPHCDKAYRYSKDKIQANGTVNCQNCGRPFLLNTNE